MADDLRIIPERDEPGASSRKNRATNTKGSAKRPPPPPKSGGSSPLVGVLCFMVILVSGAAAYLYFQTQTLSQQRDDLDNRLQSVESKLSLTGESISESGAAMEAVIRTHEETLKEHMSEIDKLWGVSYRTNRPKIEEMEKAQTSQSTDINAVKDSLAKIEPLIDGLSTLQTRVDTTANQSLALSASVDEVEGEFRSLSSSVSALEADINTQNRIVADHGEAIDAIDQYRIQINQRLLQLENQVRGTP